MYTYFSNREFKNATPSCSIEDMDEDFMKRIDKARGISGIPFIINSAYRKVEYEKEQGRDGTSSHTKGIALDIKAEGSRQIFVILKALLEVGFTRIGISFDSNFIHVDGDKEKDQRVIWGY